MTTYIIPSYYDEILNIIKTSTRESVCSAFPTTYFQACHPEKWIASTSYNVGDVVRPDIDNNYVYECTVAGISGLNEPAWEVIQDATFSDNTITWKAHLNYTLISVALDPDDNIISNGDIDGRKLVIPEKTQVLTFRSGTVAYTALLTDSNKTIHAVKTATTTAAADDDVVASRLATLYAITISQRAAV